MNYPAQRYYPELPRQRCPHCTNAMASTPYTRIVGTIRVRHHKCPVLGCGCEWDTREVVTPEPPVIAPPAPEVACPQAKKGRKR